MPYITSIKIHQFRNLSAVDITIASRFNFFFGHNGAGKTSLLEAIYYLGVGRSFRTHLPQCLIQDSTDSFSVFIEINEGKQSTPLGVERHKQGGRRLKINGEVISDWSILAKRLPLCILSTMSHQFLSDGPKVRRQFLDWILFHAEPTFFPTWKRIQRILKQRNAALKAQLSLEEITYLDEVLTQNAEYIDKLRKKITSEFNHLFQEILQHFLPEHTLILHYYRGWSEGNTLTKLLTTHLKLDLQRGYTQIGPQRADFCFSIRSLPVQDILSQGQQKLVTYALHITQGLLLKERTSLSPIYLIDDLIAELDVDKRECVVSLLAKLQSQVFVTGINHFDLDIPPNTSMFHVKRGSISIT
ncbi:DNA replication/repair protein RecF [Coxiella endosymbiont of Amblyomma nuttalli]|uniref:DNA replication/repair protein RecF n=1 Tax=Coxiella endosymbiont of Amblyomma nuttalli TaxID=2749996 RepID=UPI001BA8E915|nr:DNA replication/repair protein RecF [Coxiella endosymbiont of Amblyomma nuttalli]QTS83554.1 DNA replication and repair protein RecF [Coxiella endosymbiont of Amblyomma nuttalli]